MQRRQRVIIAVGVVLLLAIASGAALYRGRDHHPAAGLTVDWGGSEGHPCCVYDPENHTVEAEVLIAGTAPPHHTVTVTVTAYADENTSEPVGSSTRSVTVEGTVERSLVLSIPVEKAPHVDDDGIVACALSVD